MHEANEIYLLLLYGGAIIFQALAPILFVCVFVLLLVRAGRFFADVLSPDGGRSVRAERHRHRLENLAACTAVAGFVTGAVLVWNGHAYGPIIVTLPGGIEVENAGVGVFVLAIASSFMWALLHAQKSDDVASPAPQPVSTSPTSYPDAVITSVGWLNGLTYGKVGLITLALLPFIQIFAIPVGIFLAWRVSQKV